MQLMVWNINQRSGYNKQGTRQKIPDFVGKTIIASDADIVILTEFVSARNIEDLQNNQYFKDGGHLSELYDFRYNKVRDRDCEFANGVFIAVKKTFAEIKAPAIETFITDSKAKEQPNFLQIDLEVNRTPISIISTRIRVGKSSRAEYIKRHDQLVSLIDYINTLGNKRIIVAGDFNHSKICGAQDKSYADTRYRYHFTSGGAVSFLYDTYNYHILKDEFEIWAFQYLHQQGGHGLMVTATNIRKIT